ncbi:hypothetical protein [Acrocarpospora sp. B8E8]|uniref:hypothetical protein n=1 Tax=Acrocarpospora sp. B8E8 TaxID=3153572 RepID=UPI00325C843B
MDDKQRLTINQVVAFNLGSARRRAEMTQEEAAERLTAATGKKWTSNTVALAERSWATGRRREFDADELVAFCLVFGHPLGYWFLPPGSAGKEEEFLAGVEGQELDHLTLVSLALPLRPGSGFVDAANAAARVHHLSWVPSKPTWYRPEEEGLEAGPPIVAPAQGSIVDEARRRRAIEHLDAARQLLAPEEFPPF